ncbi:MAG TPA: glycosyltransferase family 9 protein [Rhodocyclaceae bacterium]
MRRIAVLGPARLGDFLFTLPMLHALRRRFRAAEILYLGQPWQAVFMAARPGPPDSVVAMPPLPGIGLPADAPFDVGIRERFVARMRGLEIDVAIQAFGGGRYSNPFVAALGARFCAGLRATGAPPLDRTIPHAGLQNRRLQLLELAAAIGAADYRLEPELKPTQADRDEAEDILGGLHDSPLVVLQPGATDPRRRWPAASFAAVGDALAGDGATIAINGTPTEAVLVHDVAAAMHASAVDLAGRLSLRGLCGLLDRAALVVSNDTGPLHLAVALGTPAVGIYWFTNLLESMPLRQQVHRAALATRVNCPECGVQNLELRCAHEPSFVAEVPVSRVLQLARDLLG